MSRPPSASRRPRADAERNRLRILDAARTLFAERGAEVQMPEIARTADVGIGTVYRHFPTQRALIEAAADHRFAEIQNFARTECLDNASPGTALACYLRHVGEVLAGDRGLSIAIETSRATPGSEPRGTVRADLESTVRLLIEKDQAAGAIREDCTVGDVYMIAGSLSAAIRTGSGDWRRLLDLVLDGLRPR
ncbi:TetR/AcrR family transcriptional regulator [Actinoallomurus iriomotensis]|uniref:TetR family transcriptional regulator n=1 Tax=Actinoallomurus iriomotensis TaxID=478107 RepID=A0A9W6S4V3_9ACTN|nr:TetR/AcrR family transcriptional regulator [Actinoallomurus iriomotensis]GLY85782.1 TetR family transcriptional regulator [Actinoallomurus iriomotensis]